MGRKKLPRLYEKYVTQQKEYRRLRKEFMHEPEEKLADATEHLDLLNLRNDINAKLEREMGKAWRLYRRIWSGEPTIEDIDAFLALVDELVTYDEFLSAKDKTSIEVHRKLIVAFKESSEKEELVE